MLYFRRVVVSAVLLAGIVLTGGPAHGDEYAEAKELVASFVGAMAAGNQAKALELGTTAPLLATMEKNEKTSWVKSLPRIRSIIKKIADNNLFEPELIEETRWGNRYVRLRYFMIGKTSDVPMVWTLDLEYKFVGWRLFNSHFSAGDAAVKRSLGLKK